MPQATVLVTPVPGRATAAAETLQTEMLRWVRGMTMRIPLPSGHSVERSAYAAMLQLQFRGPTRASDLALALGLDLSTVSRQMSGLARHGYVRKLADPGDGRASLLTLTAAGRRITDEGAAARRTFLADLLADWSEPEIITFAKLLSRFNDKFIQLCDPKSQATS
jgi:DNA-binding MarR family transcriptional regulator